MTVEAMSDSGLTEGRSRTASTASARLLQVRLSTPHCFIWWCFQVASSWHPERFVPPVSQSVTACCDRPRCIIDEMRLTVRLSSFSAGHRGGFGACSVLSWSCAGLTAIEMWRVAGLLARGSVAREHSRHRV